MKNLISLVSRFGLFAVFAVIAIGLGVHAIYGQTAAYHSECSVNNQGTDSVQLVFQPANVNCQKAADAFQAAAALVLGRQLSNGELYKYIVDARTQPYSAGFDAKFSDGLQFTDAAGFLKQVLARDEVMRTAVLNAAFREVYGGNSLPVNQAYWDPKVKAKKAWWATIVTAETTKLNNDPDLRKVTIRVAYFNSIGRAPTPAEVQYWMPMTEHYAQIIEANRGWLYSANGAQALVDATTKALKEKTKKDPNDNDIKAAMLDFTKRRATYLEMIYQ